MENVNSSVLEEYDSMQKLLEHVKEDVDRGQVLSLTVVAEMSDGSIGFSHTRASNLYTILGFLNANVLNRLGFPRERE